MLLGERGHKLLVFIGRFSAQRVIEMNDTNDYSKIFPQVEHQPKK
jgi:hypothetical protein